MKIGNKFGEWTVIEYSGGNMALCECSCGTIMEVHIDNLKTGKTKGCRKCYGERKKKQKCEEMIGKQYERLTIIGYTEDFQYICKCFCGNIKTIKKHMWGKTKSCGCYKRDMARERYTRELEIGKTYGHLTVLEVVYHDNGKVPTWKVRCELCGKEYEVNGRTIGKGEGMCSSCNFSGNRNPSWDDTISDEERCMRREWECKDYNKWIQDVFSRENYTCEKCGKRGSKLHAHHKDGYKWCKNRRTDLSNGACLCSDCHRKFHGKYGIKYNTEEQYVSFLIEELDDE